MDFSDSVEILCEVTQRVDELGSLLAVMQSYDEPHTGVYEKLQSGMEAIRVSLGALPRCGTKPEFICALRDVQKQCQFLKAHGRFLVLEKPGPQLSRDYQTLLQYVSEIQEPASIVADAYQESLSGNMAPEPSVVVQPRVAKPHPSAQALEGLGLFSMPTGRQPKPVQQNDAQSFQALGREQSPARDQLLNLAGSHEEERQGHTMQRIDRLQRMMLQKGTEEPQRRYSETQQKPPMVQSSVSESMEATIPPPPQNFTSAAVHSMPQVTSPSPPKLAPSAPLVPPGNPGSLLKKPTQQPRRSYSQEDLDVPWQRKESAQQFAQPQKPQPDQTSDLTFLVKALEARVLASEQAQKETQARLIDALQEISVMRTQARGQAEQIQALERRLETAESLRAAEHNQPVSQAFQEPKRQPSTAQSEFQNFLKLFGTPK